MPWDDSPDPVYYRILLNRDELLTVACLQSFDESDYDQSRFLKNDAGETMRWEREDEAKKYLNDHFKREFIHPDDLTPNHQDFRKYRLEDK